MTAPATSLLSERRGAVLVLTLDRPDKRNALSGAMVDALLDAMTIAAQDGTRLVVLKGNGPNFSAGFDFGGYDASSEGDLLLRFVRIEQLLQAVHHAPFDTLALAHGKNFGAGVDLICACARRVADDGASFQMPGLGFGLLLGTRRYASRVGHSVARRVLQEGTTFDAAEAERTGFLTGRAAQSEWPHLIDRAGAAAARLAGPASALLYRATAADTRCQDMADLVHSASLPGLKDRIRRYRG